MSAPIVGAVLQSQSQQLKTILEMLRSQHDQLDDLGAKVEHLEHELEITKRREQ